MHDNTFNICKIFVVFKGLERSNLITVKGRTQSATYALQESGSLAKIGNPWAIIMREHLVTKDRVGNLRSVKEVHFQETRLEVSLLGLVILQSVQ
jgi:hypothetical protein